MIGTAGSPDKIALAKAHGFDHVINYRETDFVADGEGHHRRQDVRRRLRFGRQGHVSGLARLPQAARHVRELRPVVRADPAVQPGASWRRRVRCLRRGRRCSSTLPSARIWRLGRRRCSMSSRAATVEIEINQRYALADAAAAHADLEGRRTTGTTVLIP